MNGDYAQCGHSADIRGVNQNRNVCDWFNKAQLKNAPTDLGVPQTLTDTFR